MTNSSCQNDIPSTLPIPQNITYAVIPGQNTSNPWMVHCCQPNPVHLVDACWEWCEIPPAMMTNHTTSSEILFNFGSCLQANDRNLNQSNGLSIHMATSAASSRRVTVAGLTLVAVLALSVLI